MVQPFLVQVSLTAVGIAQLLQNTSHTIYEN